MMCRKSNRFQKRGAAVATVAISGTVLIGFAAMAIDMGVIYHTRIQAQRSADAGALSGAWKLLGEDRIKGTIGLSTAIQQARETASDMAGVNRVFDSGPEVDLNTANAAEGDVVLGRLEDFTNRHEPLATNVDPSQFNSVSVLVHRDSARNGPIPFFFGQIFGLTTKDVSARAVAAARDEIVGFKVTEYSGNAPLLPFTIKLEYWQALLDGTLTTGDHYAYDPETRTVSSGSDGINELNMYPGGGGGSPGTLPPGGFGTVDIGSPDNSTVDISRQIREGVNADDLAYFGGELKLNADGVLPLSGDTGISGAINDDLLSIVGQARVIPLFTTVSGPGETATFTIVAFAGIRIMHVKLTGSMRSKQIIVQPAVVVDDTFISGEREGQNYFVYLPPALVR